MREKESKTWIRKKDNREKDLDEEKILQRKRIKRRSGKILQRERKSYVDGEKRKRGGENDRMKGHSGLQIDC